MLCERHNFEYNETFISACPCCALERAPIERHNRIGTAPRPQVTLNPPVVTETGVTAPEAQVQVNLPLTPGCIVDDQVRAIVYQGIRADFDHLRSKWGFRDYNMQFKWPDTDNHPTIEFFSAGYGAYQRFLGSMIDKCGTLRPSTKLKFIQALVAGLDRLGYFQELQTIMNAYEFQRGNTTPVTDPEEGEDGEDGEGNPD